MQSGCTFTGRPLPAARHICLIPITQPAYIPRLVQLWSLNVRPRSLYRRQWRPEGGHAEPTSLLLFNVRHSSQPTRRRRRRQQLACDVTVAAVTSQSCCDVSGPPRLGVAGQLLSRYHQHRPPSAGGTSPDPATRDLFNTDSHRALGQFNSASGFDSYLLHSAAVTALDSTNKYRSMFHFRWTFRGTMPPIFLIVAE